MRQPIFLILGYGVPQTIETNLPYRTYLNIAFNTIFARARGKEATLIPCGGSTKLTAPFDITEASVIGGYLQMMIERPDVRGQANQWRIVEEASSLSSLENLVFAKKRMAENNLHGAVTIFCEATRFQRITQTANQIFDSVEVIPIDFDVSKNRYLDAKVILKKEAAGLAEALWTLEDPARLEGHHQYFQAKIDWFRKRASEGVSHIDIVKEWYEHKHLTLIQELMPDHPILAQIKS